MFSPSFSLVLKEKTRAWKIYDTHSFSISTDEEEFKREKEVKDEREEREREIKRARRLCARTPYIIVMLHDSIYLKKTISIFKYKQTDTHTHTQRRTGTHHARILEHETRRPTPEGSDPEEGEKTRDWGKTESETFDRITLISEYTIIGKSERYREGGETERNESILLLLFLLKTGYLEEVTMRY